jgi:TfoX/Sxy family transcriptional regulator of competence genes
MDSAELEARTRFKALVEAFAGDPDISPPDDAIARGRKFGSNGLKVKNKIFAMLRQNRLVVKLPKERVAALVAAGQGERMVSGASREMKEWLVIDKRSTEDWTALAREACEFVASEVE